MFGHDLGNGVLVALHGHGDEPGSAREWGRGIAPPGWEVVAPGAPRSGKGPRSWFDSGPRGVAAADMLAAVRRVGDVVERVREGGRPVVVAGFSQGGAVALALAAHGSEVDAVVALCAFLPEFDDPLPAPGAGHRPPPVMVVGGASDDEVPAFMGEDAAAHLRSEGLPVTSTTVAGGHEVSTAVKAVVSRWIVDAVNPGLRISIGLPVDRVDRGLEFVSGAAVAELSTLYERLGYHAVFVTDHPAPDDRWLASGGHHAMDPTSVLSAAAMSTTSVLMHTNVYVLGYRNPFLAAKSLATLDVLSGGRLIAGVAAGYLRPEFDALGMSFEARGARLDEALDLLPKIWTGMTVAAEGAEWSARGVTSMPATIQQPHPPIWIGGNSTTAMRRAVRHGQGWAPFPTPVGTAGVLRTAEIADTDALARRLASIRRMCEEEGRSAPLTVCFVPFSMSAYLADPHAGLRPLVEEIEQLEELGVGWAALSVPGSSRSEVAERASALAEALELR
jgi:probable F420-dependent oxidoreductase